MPLLLLDLDNTLIDRDAAFRAAATDLLSAHGLPAADVDWLMAVDAGGFAARRDVGAALLDRYGDAVPAAAVAEFLDRGAADRVTLATRTRDALTLANAAGWRCVIVTNGRTAQQRAKVRVTGLDALVHGCAISEEVGHRKPEPGIFVAAARIGEQSLFGAWMIGDSPAADIGGACGIGIASVWLSAGRRWTEAAFRPTRVACDIASAIGEVMDRPA